MIKNIFLYMSYHLIEKWKFSYFEIQIHNFKSKIPIDRKLKIINGTKKDIKKIEEDLFPFFTYKQQYDKRFIYNLGEKGINCFLAEKNGKFVHYFMVFSNANQSPLMKTPFNKRRIKDNDIYIGNAFTVPFERGSLILPSVLNEIFKYFKNNFKLKKRAILLVHEDTLGAVKFFSILGFNKIKTFK